MRTDGVECEIIFAIFVVIVVVVVVVMFLGQRLKPPRENSVIARKAGKWVHVLLGYPF